MVIRIGLDTSKHVFQLHGVDGAERPVLVKRLRRKELSSFFAALPATVVALEAGAGAHHLARRLRGMGRDARLIAPQLAKPYVKRGKNDAADAAALCEAMSRPHMRFVPVKSPEAQAGLMLFGVRDRLVRARTQLANAVRAHAAEFGLIAPKGLAAIAPLVARAGEDAGVPALARTLFRLQAEEYAELGARLARVEGELRAWAGRQELCRRLMAVPGVGPVGAGLLAVKTPDPAAFASARAFAAWLGLTPKDHSTAGKQRLGAITRAGDEALRAVLVSGATAVIASARRDPDRADPWLKALLARKPPKLAAVALANKTARIAWALMARGERYDAGRRGRPARASA